MSQHGCRAALPESDRYTLDGLAARFEDFGVTRRKINRWVTDGLIPHAHGSQSNCRWAYYDSTHVRAIQALIAVREHAPHFADLARFLKDQNISIIQYAQQRGIVSHA